MLNIFFLGIQNVNKKKIKKIYRPLTKCGVLQKKIYMRNL